MTKLIKIEKCSQCPYCPVGTWCVKIGCDVGLYKHICPSCTLPDAEGIVIQKRLDDVGAYG